MQVLCIHSVPYVTMPIDLCYQASQFSLHVPFPSDYPLMLSDLKTRKAVAAVQGNWMPALSRKNALPVFDVLDTNMVPHDEGPREPR